MKNHPIGIMDSGVGGLTVWKEIETTLPNESTIFLGDSKNAPYGAKTVDEIFHLATKLVEFLLKQEVKLIVVACNTITLNAIDKLRETFPQVIFVGTVPVIKTAAKTSKTKRIGLLATTAGAKSAYAHSLLDTFAKDCSITIVATDKLVPLIEAGKGESQETQEVLVKELAPFQKAKIDTLVLGSTHFPFITKEIQKILGKDVHILDSGEAIAAQVQRVLEGKKMIHNANKKTQMFYTTGEEKSLETVVESLIDTGKRTGIRVERIAL